MKQFLAACVAIAVLWAIDVEFNDGRYAKVVRLRDQQHSREMNGFKWNEDFENAQEARFECRFELDDFREDERRVWWPERSIRCRGSRYQTRLASDHRWPRRQIP